MFSSVIITSSLFGFFFSSSIYYSSGCFLSVDYSTFSGSWFFSSLFSKCFFFYKVNSLNIFSISSSLSSIKLNIFLKPFSALFPLSSFYSFNSIFITYSYYSFTFFSASFRSIKYFSNAFYYSLT